MSDDATELFVELFLLLVALAVYFIPTVIAVARRHPKADLIITVNIFLGGIFPFVMAFGEFLFYGRIDWISVLGGAVILWVFILIWATRPFEKPEKPE